MDEKFDLVWKIVAWLLMLIGFVFLLLMALGFIHSPELEYLSILVSGGIFLEIGRIETKIASLGRTADKTETCLGELNKEFGELSSRFDLVWSEFRKRKSL